MLLALIGIAISFYFFGIFTMAVVQSWRSRGCQGFGADEIVEAPAEKEPILTQHCIRAKELVQEVDPLAVNGEYKRHLVYAQLIKEFPTVPRRQLSKDIENAL